MIHLQKPLFYLFIPILLSLWFPVTAFAQAPPPALPEIDWQELSTENFVIVYAKTVNGRQSGCDCGIEEAESYQAFIEQIYTELAGLFEINLKTPVNLRLFPTEESYYEVNPLAEQIPGVIAHALNNRSEIAVALPRTRSLTDEEIVNNMRHEMTHLFVSLLSDGKLTTGFQEGLAQYLEKPSDKSSYDPTVLQQAQKQNRLLSWAELDQPGQIWLDPQVAYPEALSIVAFLIDRYEFATFIEFIKTTAFEPGFRSALEATYGKSADALEAEWLLYLPDYFAGRWQINAVYTYDLSRVTLLVENRAYTDAETELLEIVELLQSTEQADTLATAQKLLDHAQQGRAAGLLANSARMALENDNYPLTIAKANQSISAFEAINDRERITELQIYIHRAEIGQTALGRLEQGNNLLNTFQFFEAEQQIRDATILLQSLGNKRDAERGTALLLQLAGRQRLLAYLMLIIGATLLTLNGLRRLARKYSANPLEVEFS